MTSRCRVASETSDSSCTYFQDPISRHAGCQMGSSSKPAVKSCQVVYIQYSPSDSKLKEVYYPPPPPLLQLQNININDFHASFHRQMISPVHHTFQVVKMMFSAFFPQAHSFQLRPRYHKHRGSICSRIHGTRSAQSDLEFRIENPKPVCASSRL